MVWCFSTLFTKLLISGDEKTFLPAVPLQHNRVELCPILLCLLLVAPVRAAETNDVNRLKPNQVISPGSTPRPPTVFNPDPNPLILPTNLPPVTNWWRNVSIHSNAPPAAPLQFNPDPGA